MALAEELRCLVCQNQTLADSHAPLADGPEEPHPRAPVAGKGERDVLDFMVPRYGDFVLYRPPLRKATAALLWAGPFVLLAIGMGALVAVASPQDTEPRTLRTASLAHCGSRWSACPVVAGPIYLAVGTPAAFGPQKAAVQGRPPPIRTPSRRTRSSGWSHASPSA